MTTPVAPPILVPAHRRSPPGGTLSLASDLRVLLGWVRRHSDGGPDSGVNYQLELVIAARSRCETDLPEPQADERMWVLPAVLATPMLHAPIDMPALMKAFKEHINTGPCATSLDDVLLPRPPGTPLRRAVWPGAGWQAPRIARLPHRRALDVQQAVLQEHPEMLELMALRHRAKGRLLAEAHQRASVLKGSERFSLGSVNLPSLAAELAMMCPDGNAVRRLYPGRPASLRGAYTDEGARLALMMVADALSGGDQRPAVHRAGQDWITAISEGNAFRQRFLLDTLREQARKGLRQLRERGERPRLVRRQVEPYLVADLRCAARPFPSEMLWQRGGSEASLVSTAHLLRDALRQGEVLDAVRMAADGKLESVRFSTVVPPSCLDKQGCVFMQGVRMSDQAPPRTLRR